MHLFNHAMNNTIETDGYTRLSLKIIGKLLGLCTFLCISVPSLLRIIYCATMAAYRFIRQSYTILVHMERGRKRYIGRKYTCSSS